MEPTTEVWRRPTLQNWWVFGSRDPRIDSFERLSSALQEAVDVAWGSISYDPDRPDAGVPPIPRPLELAAFLREAAERIEEWTEPDLA